VKVRLIALGALIVALAITAALLPLGKIPDAIASLGPWAPVVATAAAALALSALVPRTAITLACGAAFGPLAGGVVALIAALIAAVATFAIGRSLGRDAIATWAPKRWARVDSWLTRRGLLAVIVVRSLPIGPFGLIGYAYGTTAVRRWHYALGTLIGSTPSAFTYAAVGAEAVRPGAHRLITLVPAAAGLLLTLIAAIYWRVSGRHRK
jgi:uncharacterized membrane protein YdjX (TVP38/TMEM64 family)